MSTSPQDILAHLYQLLGRAVLLPYEPRRKFPPEQGWQRRTYADTQRPEYQRNLIAAIKRGGNIGVRLGEASEGLVSIDIDDDELAETFIPCNPFLVHTLRTRGKRGCNFWLRIKPGTGYPNAQGYYKLKNLEGQQYGEWRVGGGDKGAQTLLLGIHPEDIIYRILVDKPVLEIDFSQLNWLGPPPADQESQEIETDGDGEQQDDEPQVFPYPEIDQIAFCGPFGRIIKVIEPLTEADPAALLVQLLVGWGNAIGRGAYYSVGPDKHYTNLNACIVGKSGRSRKGLSLSVDRWILSQIDQKWERENIRGGLSSGEGLIWQVRDPIIKTEAVKEKGRYTGARQEYVEDEGIKDKRLLIAETEFGSALTVMGRTGNSLSAVIRDAFDSKHRLGTLVKNSPAVATDPHISIVGHITRFELRSRIKECEQTNGFVNRFLWICSRRHGVLPNPKDLAQAGLGHEVAELTETTVWAKKTGEMERDSSAETFWAGIYRVFAEDEEESVISASVDRGDVFMLRLSMLYALSEGSRVIKAEHLRAAHALWKYAEASARHVFGEWIGNPKAEKIFEALRRNPEGLTRWQINDLVFKRHLKAELLEDLLQRLLKLGWVTVERKNTGGRSAECFKAKNEKTKSEVRGK